MNREAIKIIFLNVIMNRFFLCASMDFLFQPVLALQCFPHQTKVCVFISSFSHFSVKASSANSLIASFCLQLL